jgi:hypothetical protein
MTTAADIIALALRHSGVIGVGQTAMAEDTNDAFALLNMMLSQWSRKRWLVYHLIDVFTTSTGALRYSIGAGGDFNTPRPDRIESAFARQIIPSGQNRIDYPLDLIQSREDYNLIALKTLGTWPSAVFYDSDYPLGYVYFWPLPQSGQFDLHLSLKQTLAQFANLADEINLPPEYIPTLFYNLAARLRPAYQMPPDPTITALAMDSLNVIRGANAQIPSLRMPNAVVGQGRSYNVYSDQ